ncbi:uncharacterized protein Nmag_0720 [Natrialba magadii ATCC 43099]|uniref:Uncharacterized protein n=1 Tax=Natrialba magadii (strain ATCC 43099 / DSM 3394 / CCM 3739 / CIP 104546 / IAM 13178 / JCM 8861 / NBRC 102185 / NCIMB 2190 / MS3) TaxID=547559 RepID=D3SZH1_NATMM|nr:hypothetical protein [Natrialba magadii]ADD04305.1 uncharacterized protein Nmag_0720 [Natrialba magadii ATCC 43099]ELY26707.1 hypothetical protein C500_16140 [Natrialba magadii ATCC 43099]
MDRTEQWTAALAGCYLATLGLVYVLDDPRAWLLWAVGMVVVSGAVLIAFNRTTPAEDGSAADREAE